MRAHVAVLSDFDKTARARVSKQPQLKVAIARDGESSHGELSHLVAWDSDRHGDKALRALSLAKGPLAFGV